MDRFPLGLRDYAAVELDWQDILEKNEESRVSCAKSSAMRKHDQTHSA